MSVWGIGPSEVSDTEEPFEPRGALASRVFSELETQAATWTIGLDVGRRPDLDPSARGSRRCTGLTPTGFP